MRWSPGAYVLIVDLPTPANIHIGKMGPLSLEKGHYLYCGSAQAGLLPRMARHMRPEKKRRWHIDHLTCQGQVVGALTFRGEKDTECWLAGTLSRMPAVEPIGRRFGSSDCGCPTHLFHVKDDLLLSLVLDLLSSSFSERAFNGQSI